ncbi:hypothetical protein HDU77_007285 [Chytriomyces hyalinus]|nr:hypothetical protein HDU77_007285 [Chytriomyces hyalinus]
MTACMSARGRYFNVDNMSRAQSTFEKIRDGTFACRQDLMDALQVYSALCSQNADTMQGQYTDPQSLQSFCQANGVALSIPAPPPPQPEPTQEPPAASKPAPSPSLEPTLTTTTVFTTTSRTLSASVTLSTTTTRAWSFSSSTPTLGNSRPDMGLIAGCGFAGFIVLAFLVKYCEYRCTTSRSSRSAAQWGPATPARPVQPVALQKVAYSHPESDRTYKSGGGVKLANEAKYGIPSQAYHPQANYSTAGTKLSEAYGPISAPPASMSSTNLQSVRPASMASSSNSQSVLPRMSAPSASGESVLPRMSAPSTSAQGANQPPLVLPANPRDWTVSETVHWAKTTIPESGERIASLFLFHKVSGVVLLGLNRDLMKSELGLKYGETVVLQDALDALLRSVDLPPPGYEIM